MQPDYNDAIQYVHSHLAQGFSEQQLREQFMQSGWTTEQISNLFAQTPPQPTSVAPASVVQPSNVLPQSSVAINNSEPIITSPVSSPVSVSQSTATSSELLSSNIDTTESQKFKVFKAIGLAIKAMFANPKNYFLSVILCFIFILVVGIGIGMVFTMTASTFMNLPFAVFFWIIPLIIGLLFYSVAIAYYTQATSRAIADGKMHLSRSLRELIFPDKNDLWRVSKTQVLTGLIVFGPVYVVYAIALFWILGSSKFLQDGGGSSPIVLIILVIFSIVWILITSLRYMIAPIVAVFEPDITARAALKRSHHLLQHGGQWFLVKGYILLILISIVLSVIFEVSVFSNYDQGQNTGLLLLLQIIMALIYLVSNAVLTVLYLNRAIVRGNQ